MTGQSTSVLLRIAVSVIGGLMVLAFAEPWLNVVDQMQSSAISALDNPRADYIQGVLWALGLTTIVIAWGTVSGLRRQLLLIWAAKVVIGLGVMLLYDSAYGVDPDGYYMNASTPGFEWTGLEVGAGTINTRQVAWLHYRWLSESFNAARLSFALLGLFSIFLFYRAAEMAIDRKDPRLLYFFALTPSILFWSSILGKDPITFFGVCAYVYGVVTWHKQGRSSGILWIAVGVSAALVVRAWLGPILLIPLFVLGAFRAHSRAARLGLVALAIAGVIFGPGLVRMATGRTLGTGDEVLAIAGEASQSFEQGGSTRAAPEISSYGDLAAFAPLGIFTILFRPFPGEVPNLFGTIAGFENLCLFLLACRAVWKSRASDLKDPLVGWALCLLILWAAVYSVVSFQNLGTASRYKLEMTPLLLGLILYLGRPRTSDVLADASLAPQPLRPLWNK